MNFEQWWNERGSHYSDSAEKELMHHAWHHGFKWGQQDAERRLMSSLPCGHPRVVFYCGEEPLHCFWCESLEQVRAEERERLADMVENLEQEYYGDTWTDKMHFVAQAIREAGEKN